MLSAILGSEISKGIQRAIIIVAVLAVLLLAAWLYFRSTGKNKSTGKSSSSPEQDNDDQIQSGADQTSNNSNSKPADTTNSQVQRGTHIKNSRITYVEASKDKRE